MVDSEHLQIESQFDFDDLISESNQTILQTTTEINQYFSNDSEKVLSFFFISDRI